jgi:CheY-like chemotaxis protein
VERGYDARRRRPVSRLRPPRVLVCDDTDAVRHLIRVNLELEGYDVIEAHDGEEALNILASITDAEDDPLPDVVTVDALMPRRDGWWTVGMIRTDPRLEHIPVVMVTASVQSHHRAQAEQAAVDGFIAKPFEPDELIALVGVLASGGRV